MNSLKRLSLILLWMYALLTVYNVAAIPFHLPRPNALTPITTLVGFSFALLHASLRLGWKRALILLALVFGVSLAFESIGVATGLVYGPYHYTY